MHKNSLRILAALVVLCCAAASFAFSPNKDADALKALDAEWSKAAATRDADKVAAFYADDAVAYPPNEPVATGKAAARKAWAGIFAEPSSKIAWKTVNAGADGNLGFTAGTYEASGKGPDGKIATEKGKYVCIWHKGADGKWKAIHDIWNSNSK
jgi:uncharacterized protein (TIGR02246 family)